MLEINSNLLDKITIWCDNTIYKSYEGYLFGGKLSDLKKNDIKGYNIYRFITGNIDSSYEYGAQVYTPFSRIAKKNDKPMFENKIFGTHWFLTEETIHFNSWDYQYKDICGYKIESEHLNPKNNSISFVLEDAYLTYSLLSRLSIPELYGFGYKKVYKNFDYGNSRVQYEFYGEKIDEHKYSKKELSEYEGKDLLCYYYLRDTNESASLSV